MSSTMSCLWDRTKNCDHLRVFFIRKRCICKERRADSYLPCLYIYCIYIILEWTTSLHTSSRTCEDVGMCVHVTSNVELRNNVRLLLNVKLRNYVISRQIVERRVTSECYLNMVVSLDC